MEQNLVTRSLTMEYALIGCEGDFCQKAAKLAFVEISNVLTKARNVTIQGISSTGFLTISIELMSKQVGTRQSTSHNVLLAQSYRIISMRSQLRDSLTANNGLRS